MSLQPIVEVKEDAPAVADAAAQLVLDLAHSADLTGPTAVCLSGGNTPRLLYEKLASSSFVHDFPWQKIHWFWGDERYVAEDDVLSNYRMVHEAMLAHVSVPEMNIHRVKTELVTPQATADDYEAQLKSYYGGGKLESERPLFLINFLGLGTDGHTASLFPGTEVLKEQIRWAAAVENVKAEPRITLTYPVLNSSLHVIFLVTGAEKKEILKRFLDRDPSLPAVHVAPAGQLYIFADRSAAAG